MSEEDRVWLRKQLHGDDCRQCRLVRELLDKEES